MCDRLYSISCENPFLNPTLFVDPLERYTRGAHYKLMDLVDWTGCFSRLIPYNHLRHGGKYGGPNVPDWALKGCPIQVAGDPVEACSQISGLNMPLSRWTIARHRNLLWSPFVFVFESSDDAALVMMVL